MGGDSINHSGFYGANTARVNKYEYMVLVRVHVRVRTSVKYMVYSVLNGTTRYYVIRYRIRSGPPPLSLSEEEGGGQLYRYTQWDLR